MRTQKIKQTNKVINTLILYKKQSLYKNNVSAKQPALPAQMLAEFRLTRPRAQKQNPSWKLEALSRCSYPCRKQCPLQGHHKSITLHRTHILLLRNQKIPLQSTMVSPIGSDVTMSSTLQWNIPNWIIGGVAKPMIACLTPTQIPVHNHMRRHANGTPPSRNRHTISR